MFYNYRLCQLCWQIRAYYAGIMLDAFATYCAHNYAWGLPGPAVVSRFAYSLRTMVGLTLSATVFVQ